MNNDLNSLILSNARETVAKERGFAKWTEFADSIKHPASGLVVMSTVSELAMEELAGFLRWMFIHGYDLSEFEKRYAQYLNDKKDEGE